MRRFTQPIQRSILTGIVILIPAVVALYLAYSAFIWVDGLLPTLLGIALPPGVGVAGILLIALITGLVARNFVGKLLIRVATSIIVSVPVLNKVYLTLQQIMDMFANPKRNSLGKVVMVEYPRKGSWVLGFITTYETSEISEGLGEKVVCVYVPTAPNPTSGITLYVPERDTVAIKMSTELVMKAIVSAGIVSSAKTDTRRVEHSLPDLVAQWYRNARRDPRVFRPDPRD